MKSEVAIFAHNAIQKTHQYLDQINDIVEQKVFSDVIDLIVNHKHNVIFTGIGKSGHVCKKATATFASLGTQSYFVNPVEASHGDLGMLSTRDILLCVSNTGNTKEIHDIVNFANQNSIPVIGIARSIDTFLGKNSKYFLRLNCPEILDDIPAPTISTTLTVCLLDIMAMCVAKARNFTLSDYNRLHPGGKLGEMSKKISQCMQNVVFINDTHDINRCLETFLRHNVDILCTTDNMYVTKEDILNRIFKKYPILPAQIVNPDIYMKDIESRDLLFIFDNDKIIGFYKKYG